MITILFYLLAVLFVAAMIVSWVSNLFGLPGNWFMAALAGVWCYFTDVASVHHLGWVVIVALVVLAGVGELVEFAASVFGTKKVGGSRRAAMGSLGGSFVGAIAGGFIGIPLLTPLIGMVVGTVLFACLGAWVGATLGEKSDGSEMGKSLKVGGAAAVGRFVGTIGKAAFGAAMLALAILNLFI